MSGAFSWRRVAVLGAVLVTTVSVAVAFGASLGAERAEQRLVAVSWGDGARFGKVTWEPAGLTIGTGPGRYFLPRAELERHR
jgi:hypothetical protein